MTPWLRYRLTTGSQRHRPWCVGTRFDQQRRDRNGQGGRHRFQRRDGDVFRAAFDPADIGPVDARRERQALLRQPALNAQPP